MKVFHRFCCYASQQQLSMTAWAFMFRERERESESEVDFTVESEQSILARAQQRESEVD